MNTIDLANGYAPLKDNPGDGTGPINTSANLAALVTQTIRALPPLPQREVALPREFARVERQAKTGRLVLENRFIVLPDRGELRSVLIRSPKIDIVTLFFFPQPVWQLPVFATEFVVLGPRPVLGVIDASCLLAPMDCDPAVERVFSDTRHAYPQLRQADDPPRWYQECRSGRDFFVRPRDRKELTALGAAHLQTWTGVAELLRRPARFDPQAAAVHQRRLQDYKTHRRLNSPGLQLMQRSFGADWTDAYMRNYLFR